MRFQFVRFMASRYLRGAQGRAEGSRFLRFIIYVSIGGVAVGVAALLLALSVVRGFSMEIRNKIISFGGHVQVENYQDAPLDSSARREARLREVPGVRAVAPMVLELALLKSRTEIDGVAFWGTEGVWEPLAREITSGAFRFEPDTAGRPGLVIGAKLAGLLGVRVGDRVTAFSMRELPYAGEGGETAAFRRPRLKQFHVAGVFETGLANFDELYVFVDIGVARDLLGYAPTEVTRFDLMVEDVERADDVARAVEERLGFPVMARSVFQVYRNLFAWVDLQQSIIPLVIGVIILVAAFNIVGTLLMLMLEKTGEIGILSGMGASPGAIRRLFVWLGLLIGVFGTTLGAGVALVLAVLQKRFEIIPLPQEAYYIDSAPIELNPLDFVVVAAVALALCVVAAYIPARAASRIPPLQAIRFSS